MRELLLREQWTKAGAVLVERHGVQVVSHVSGLRAEHVAVRDAVGITDFSFMQKYRVPLEKGDDLLDGALAGNVAKIRFGRMLHTFMPDNSGHVVGDCYVANNDEELILLCEGIATDGDIRERLQPAGASDGILEDLTESHVLLGIDGFKAWAVVKELFGADVLGLAYLSVEVFPFEGESVYLFRAGKTSEFGYLLMAPAGVAAKLSDALTGIAARHGGVLCGVDAHNALRLEGRFFNIHAEGASVRDPLVLGLQWMIDFEKDRFHGAEAIKQRRAAGLKQKIVGVAAAPGQECLGVGAKVFHGQGGIGEVVAAAFSPSLNRQIGLAVLPIGLAFAGLRFTVGAAGGSPVETISMPPIFPKSLQVKLDEM
ncbi:MAG: glycine cleavage T C-terminal barrel domain-containing protein [bacterium]